MNEEQKQKDMLLIKETMLSLANSFREQGRMEVEREKDALVEELKNTRQELQCAETRLRILDNKIETQDPHPDCHWVAVSSGETPMDGEQVVVETESGVRFMQTYFGGFTSGVVYWLRLPEN